MKSMSMMHACSYSLLGGWRAEAASCTVEVADIAGDASGALVRLGVTIGGW